MDRKKEIADLKKKLAELELDEKAFNELGEDAKLAEILHEKLCHANHTDECSWYYDTLNSHAFSEYSNKARELLKITDFDTIVKLIKVL